MFHTERNEADGSPGPAWQPDNLLEGQFLLSSSLVSLVCGSCPHDHKTAAAPPGMSLNSIQEDGAGGGEEVDKGPKGHAS